MPKPKIDIKAKVDEMRKGPPTKHEAKLDGEQREFVFYALAGNVRPAVIVRELLSTFEITITNQAICYIRKRYQSEIREIRLQCRDYIENVCGKIRFTDKLDRLQALSFMIGECMAKRHYIDAAKMLRQMAEEMGDLSQKYEIGGPNGGAIELSNASRDEVVDGIRSLIEELKQSAPALPSESSTPTTRKAP